MTTLGAAQFFKAAKQNQELQTRLKATADPEAFVAIAAQYGYHFSVADLHDAIQQLSPAEIAAMVNPGVGPRQHLIPR